MGPKKASSKKASSKRAKSKGSKSKKKVSKKKSKISSKGKGSKGGMKDITMDRRATPISPSQNVKPQKPRSTSRSRSQSPSQISKVQTKKDAKHQIPGGEVIKEFKRGRYKIQYQAMTDLKIHKKLAVIDLSGHKINLGRGKGMTGNVDDLTAGPQGKRQRKDDKTQKKAQRTNEGEKVSREPEVIIIPSSSDEPVPAPAAAAAAVANITPEEGRDQTMYTSTSPGNILDQAFMESDKDAQAAEPPEAPNIQDARYERITADMDPKIVEFWNAILAQNIENYQPQDVERALLKFLKQSKPLSWQECATNLQRFLKLNFQFLSSGEYGAVYGIPRRQSQNVFKLRKLHDAKTDKALGPYSILESVCVEVIISHIVSTTLGQPVKAEHQFVVEGDMNPNETANNQSLKSLHEAFEQSLDLDGDAPGGGASDQAKPEKYLIIVQQCQHTIMDWMENNLATEPPSRSHIERRANQLLSLLIQIVLMIAQLEEKYAFIHEDVQHDNIMYRQTRKRTATYTVGDATYGVITHGIEPVLINFAVSEAMFRLKDDQNPNSKGKLVKITPEGDFRQQTVLTSRGLYKNVYDFEYLVMDQARGFNERWEPHGLGVGRELFEAWLISEEDERKYVKRNESSSSDSRPDDIRLIHIMPHPDFEKEASEEFKDYPHGCGGMQCVLKSKHFINKLQPFLVQSGILAYVSSQGTAPAPAPAPAQQPSTPPRGAPPAQPTQFEYARAPVRGGLPVPVLPTPPPPPSHLTTSSSRGRRRRSGSSSGW